MIRQRASHRPRRRPEKNPRFSAGVDSGRLLTLLPGLLLDRVGQDGRTGAGVADRDRGEAGEGDRAVAGPLPVLAELRVGDVDPVVARDVERAGAVIGVDLAV